MSTRWSEAVIFLSMAVAVAACNQKVEGEGATAPLAVQIGAENVVSVQSGTIVVGPIISGELTPTREATVRAELGGAVLEVKAEEAQAVAKGALLARIETRTLEDARDSAASAVRSAENQLAVARRDHQLAARHLREGQVDDERRLHRAVEALPEGEDDHRTDEEQRRLAGGCLAPGERDDQPGRGLAGPVADRVDDRGDAVDPRDVAAHARAPMKFFPRTPSRAWATMRRESSSGTP